MRLPLLLCVTTLAASAVLAQESASPSSPSKSSQSTQSDQSSQSSQSSSSILSPTGRGSGHASGQQHFRSTKIIGAQVKTSSGESVGRIEDVVLNPTSGRIDFAVISAEGKLVPVPWQLLSVSGQGGASAQGGTSSSSTTTSGTSAETSTSTPGSSGIYASASASGQQPSFTLNIDKSKLQSGPSFDRSRWPEMSASWSQRVYSHFGVQPESATGGTGAGSFRSGSQGSTGSSTDTDSGKANSDSSDKSDKSSTEDKK